MPRRRIRIQAIVKALFPKSQGSHAHSPLYSFAEIIFDILIVACLRHIVIEIKLNFFAQGQTSTLETLWLLIFFLNILVLWFYFIYYAQLFESRNFKSRLTFFFIFLSISLLVFTIYSDFDNKLITQDRSVLHFGALMLSYLVMGSIFTVYLLKSAKNNISKKNVLVKILSIFGAILVINVIAIFGIMLINNPKSSWIFLATMELVIFIFGAISIKNLLEITYGPNNILELEQKLLQDRFILLTSICLGETVISIFDCYIDNNIFDKGLSAASITKIFFTLIMSISIVYLLYCIYVDRMHIMNLKDANRTIYWYVFNHLGIIMGLIFISKGISTEIIEAILFYNGHGSSNTNGILFWGVIMFLLSITNTVIMQLHSLKHLNKQSIFTNMDLIIGTIMLMILSSIIVLFIDPMIYIIVVFGIMLILNLTNIWFLLGNSLRKTKDDDVKNIILK